MTTSKSYNEKRLVFSRTIFCCFFFTQNVFSKKQSNIYIIYILHVYLYIYFKTNNVQNQKKLQIYNHETNKSYNYVCYIDKITNIYIDNRHLYNILIRVFKNILTFFIIFIL